MKKQNILKYVILFIAIAINIFIIINAFINGETSAKESNSVAQGTADIINTVKPETITQENFPDFASFIRKAYGHYGLFALSGIFSSWSLYLFAKDSKIGYFLYQLGFTFTFGFLIAIISEFAQKFVKDRVGSWTDVGIDMLGYFSGVLLLFLLFLICKSPIFSLKKTKENQAN